MSKIKTAQQIANELAAPFTVIGLDGRIYPAHKWKVQTAKGLCVPYIDARQAQQRLNDILGVDGWGNTFIETNGDGLICEITALIEGKEVRKSNVGTRTSIEAEKGQASDAIKRAATAFGVGTYLYDMQPVQVKMSGKFPVDEKGNILSTGDELSSFINLKNPLMAKLFEIWNSLNETQKKSLQNDFSNIKKALEE